jgi:hypothetical protein
MPTTGNRPAGQRRYRRDLEIHGPRDDLARDVVLLTVAAVCSGLLARLMVDSR